MLSGTKVNLTWTDAATNETGYLLERSANGGAFTSLASLSANAGSYVDGTPEFGYRYTYRLTAVTPYAQSVEAEASLNLAVRRGPVTRTTAPTKATTAITTKTVTVKAMPVLMVPTAKVVAIAKAIGLRSIAADVLER